MGIRTWRKCTGRSHERFMRAAAVMFAVAFQVWGQSPVDIQVKQTRDLIAAHRAAIPRLASVAEASAQILLKGGGFYLCCGENAWIQEGDSRAGGPIGIQVARKTEQVAADSVVWVSYDSSNYERVLAEVARMPRGVYVVAFGPKPKSEFPPSVGWVDCQTGWDADSDLTLMGNVLSLWSLTGEVAAAASRAGKTLAFYQSAWMPGGNARNGLYSGQTFHKRTPKMQPVERGVLAGSYLEAIEVAVAGIAEGELAAIRTVRKTIDEHASAGKPVALVVTSHLMSGVAAKGNRAYRFEPDAAQLASKLSGGDYVVSLGYSGIDDALYKAVHRAGAGAAWALASSVKPAEPASAGDTFLDEHWEAGDAAVTVWGYDVPILPPSGIAQLFLYRLLFER